jgi:uncharacterized protein (TIGR03790 family)
MRYLLLLGLTVAATLSAQPLPERVLVVYNSNVPDSLSVASAYSSKRGIPAANLCAISTSTVVSLSQSEYETGVRDKVRACLNTVGKTKILYIVFSYQTPYKFITNSRQFSLDSAVADVWDEHTTSFGTYPGDPHPYYAFVQSQGNYYDAFVSLAAYRASPGAKNIYSVWRLDGPTMAIANGLVDKAIAAEAGGLSGVACLDRRFGNVNNQPDSGVTSGDWDLARAAGFAAQAGFTVIEDANSVEFGTAPAPLRCDGAVFYAGWYSYNNYNDAFTWNTGAMGFHLDSASALDPRGGPNWAANALSRGITLTSGSVNEPYLDGLIHPDGFLRDLLGGANAGDAAFRHTPNVKWMVTQIGDPLYRPFPGGRAPFPLPPQDWLVIYPQVVLGGTSTVGYVGLAAPAAAPVTVTLSSRTVGVATVPPSVTIAAGSDYATFPISTSVAKATSTAILNAAFGGKTLANAVTTVPTLASLTVSPTSLTGGQPATGTVGLNVIAPAGGTVVSLSSSLAGVTVPATVTVPAGSSSASFSIATSIGASGAATITASLLGATKTATLNMTGAVLSTFTIAPSAVTGTETAMGTVTLTGAAPSGGVAVTLSSNRAEAVVPASVTVPAGASSANFTISTASVGAIVSADITATAGVSRTTRLTIQPVLQAFNVSPTQQMGGAAVNLTISLVNNAPAGGRIIQLTSGSLLVPVPANVTVPAGTRSLVVPVTTLPAAATTPVLLEAIGGASTRTATLTLERVLISGIGGGATVKGGLTLNISVQLPTAAGPGGASVAMSSTNPAVASVPPTIVVPAGASSVVVPVTTTAVAASTPVTIRATGPVNFRERVITVTP